MLRRIKKWFETSTAPPDYGRSTSTSYTTTGQYPTDYRKYKRELDQTRYIYGPSHHYDDSITRPIPFGASSAKTHRVAKEIEQFLPKEFKVMVDSLNNLIQISKESLSIGLTSDFVQEFVEKFGEDYFTEFVGGFLSKARRTIDKL